MLVKNFGRDVAYVERQESHQIFRAAQDQPSPATILEQYFGIHFRIREGVIEFYRKEERQNFY